MKSTWPKMNKHVTYPGWRHVFIWNFNMSAPTQGSDLGCSQYLFVMLHLQSFQLTSLCTFSLTLVLCLMKLNHKHTHTKTNPNPTLESSSVIIVFQQNLNSPNHASHTVKNRHLTWFVKLVIWPWSLSTCRLKSSFSSFIRSLSLLSFLKSSSKIFTWSTKQQWNAVEETHV